MATEDSTLGIFSPFVLGRGYVEVVRAKSPGNGNSFTMTVPGGEQWRIRSFSCIFTTSAVVANRTVIVTYRDGDSTQFLVIPATSSPQAANAALTYSGAIGAPYLASALGNLCPLADLILQAGYQFRIGVDSIDAGDNLSTIRVLIEKIVHGVGGYELGMQPGGIQIPT